MPRSSPFQPGAGPHAHPRRVTCCGPCTPNSSTEHFVLRYLWEDPTTGEAQQAGGKSPPTPRAPCPCPATGASEPLPVPNLSAGGAVPAVLRPGALSGASPAGFLQRLASLPAEHPAGPKPSPRAPVAMTVTARSCSTGTRAPTGSSTTAGRAEARTGASTEPGECAARCCAGRRSRTGSGDPTATAPRGRRATSPTWAPGRRSRRLRCGSPRPGPPRRPSRSASPGPGTAPGCLVSLEGSAARPRGQEAGRAACTGSREPGAESGRKAPGIRCPLRPLAVGGSPAPRVTARAGTGWGLDPLLTAGRGKLSQWARGIGPSRE